MLKPKSLQQRLIFFLLTPIALLMLGIGLALFTYAASNMLNQWREASTLRLQRAAHHVDMRLGRTKELIRMYHDAARMPYAQEVRKWLIEQLRDVDGVVRVDVVSSESESAPGHEMHSSGSECENPQSATVSHGARKRDALRILPPRYDSASNHKTISLISEAKKEQGGIVESIEVAIRFDELAEDILATTWWQSDKAYIVDDTGDVLACTTGEHHSSAFENTPLESATLRAIKEKRYGTVLDTGFLPDEVSGFHSLREAPWSVVVIAPARVILAPIIRFAIGYFLIGTAAILLILILIRNTTAPAISTLKDVSKAAERVALGDYGDPLAVKSEDEVGQLVQSFNSMVLQLEERMKLKESMNVAMKVQQSLLPGQAPQVKGLDIAGKSIYCDETGGDYYDFLRSPGMGNDCIGIAVGDVMGHGIGAALLMTTARAFLRSKATVCGRLSQTISEVNRLLCFDTRESSSFMTMFYMVIDSEEQRIEWVRAGHDPAIVYNPSSDTFEELRGKGLVLGVDEEESFPEYSFPQWVEGQIIVIGTDGIWETENPQNERFGKLRVKEIIRENRDQSAEEILEAITDALTAFRGTAPQRDDVTMVIVKIKEGGL